MLVKIAAKDSSKLCRFRGSMSYVNAYSDRRKILDSRQILFSLKNLNYQGWNFINLHESLDPRYFFTHATNTPMHPKTQPP